MAQVGPSETGHEAPTPVVSGKRQKQPAPTICIVGPNAAGKSELARRFSAIDDLPVLEFGDVVRGLQRRDASLSVDASVAYRQIISRSGYEALVHAAETITQQGGRSGVFVGLREPQAIVALRCRFPTMRIVALVCPQASRRMRARFRDRDEFDLQAELFSRRDAEQLTWGLAHTIGMADLVLDSSPAPVILMRQLTAWTKEAAWKPTV